MHQRCGFLLAVAVVTGAPLELSCQTGDRLPSARAGQWEVHKEMRSPDAPDFSLAAPSQQVCIDPATARQAMEHALQLASRCPIKREGGGWVSTCRAAVLARDVVSKTTISGDFESTITVRVETMEDGRLTAFEVRNARWVGAACTNGMLPGDIAWDIPDVPKFNVNNLEEMKESLDKMGEHTTKKFDDLDKKRLGR